MGYTQVKGLIAAAYRAKGKKQLLEEAVQFIQLVLLTDLRPPWLAHNSPQALPGGGVLSRFTRPQLLFWPASGVANLFGEELNRSFDDAAESVHLVFAGIIARPLYKCTEPLSTGKVCMKVASMSPFLQITAGRRAYKCTDCMAKAQGAQVAPGSASAALRCLHASPTVRRRRCASAQ